MVFHGKVKEVVDRWFDEGICVPSFVEVPLPDRYDSVVILIANADEDGETVLKDAGCTAVRYIHRMGMSLGLSVPFTRAQRLLCLDLTCGIMSYFSSVTLVGTRCGKAQLLQLAADYTRDNERTKVRVVSVDYVKHNYCGLCAINPKAIR
jgi:hypothetical protein